MRRLLAQPGAEREEQTGENPGSAFYGLFFATSRHHPSVEGRPPQSSANIWSPYWKSFIALTRVP